MQGLGFGLTNAAKGLISAVVSSGLALLVAFGFDLSAEQVSAIISFVNAALALWIGLTAGGSPALRDDKNAIRGTSK